MTVKTFDQWIDLVGNGNIKDIENEILNNKNILNLQDSNGNTALFYSLKLQKILLDRKQGKKMTFDDQLKYYIEYTELEKVQGFINSGISVNARYEGDSNLTLLQHVKNVFNAGKEWVIEILIILIIYIGIIIQKIGDLIILMIMLLNI